MTLFYVMLVCAMTIAVLLSRCRAPKFEEPYEGQVRHFEKLVVRQGENAFSHLYHLSDKQVFFTVDKRSGADKATLLYRPQGTTLVALGDPFGDPDSFNQLSTGSVDYADIFQCPVALCEVDEERSTRHINEGMNLVRLGEDTTVDIFGLAKVGSKGKTFRHMHNKLESPAYTSKVVEAPYSPDLTMELRDVSQA